MELADRLGFDGVCLNEHHQTAYGMMPIPGVLAGALARSIKRAKIAVLGRALPLLNNPLMVAEEYAMLDNLTRGRFIAGFVRGIGAEYHAMGINPAESQERFAEAHDLIVRAWTETGPFAYSGKHYQFNYVNTWPRPYQTPHPPIWMPSQGSGSTIRWAAQMRYTYCQTLSPIAAVATILPALSRRSREGRLRSHAGPTRLVEHDLCRGNRCARRSQKRAAPRSAGEPAVADAARDAAAAGLHQLRGDGAHSRGQSHRQTADHRGPDQGRRRHHRQPEHGAREARRISGSRRIQHVADQNSVRHPAERHGARQHTSDRPGNPAGIPRPLAARQEQQARPSSTAERVQCVARALHLLLIAWSDASLVQRDRLMAQDYPTREIRTICPFAPGTGADIIVRFYASKLAEIAGKPVITENRAGAQGLLGTEAVAQAKPDGYTIAIKPIASTMAAAPHIFKNCRSIRSRTLSPAER